MNDASFRPYGGEENLKACAVSDDSARFLVRMRPEFPTLAFYLILKELREKWGDLLYWSDEIDRVVLVQDE